MPTPLGLEVNVQRMTSVLCFVLATGFLFFTAAAHADEIDNPWGTYIPAKKSPPKKTTSAPIKKSAGYNDMDTAYLDELPHFSVGIAYTGAQVRWRMTENFAAEARYLHDTAATGTGKVNAGVAGARLYYLFPPSGHITFYGGGEVGALLVRVTKSDPTLSGHAFGAFGGLEYRLSRRFSFGADVGMYRLLVKSSVVGIEETGVDFILNSYINFHIF